MTDPPRPPHCEPETVASTGILPGGGSRPSGTVPGWMAHPTVHPPRRRQPPVGTPRLREGLRAGPSVPAAAVRLSLPRSREACLYGAVALAVDAASSERAASIVERPASGCGAGAHQGWGADRRERSGGRRSTRPLLIGSADPVWELQGAPHRRVSGQSPRGRVRCAAGSRGRLAARIRPPAAQPDPAGKDSGSATRAAPSAPPPPEGFLRHELAPMEGAPQPSRKGRPVRNRSRRPLVTSASHSCHGCPSAEPCVRFGYPTSILLLGPPSLACLSPCETLSRRPP